MSSTPRDYDTDPERFRLASRVTERHLRGAVRLHERIAGVLAAAGARLILDIGCGEGALCAVLPSGTQGARVIGLDASATMLSRHPPPVVLAEATALPFPGGVFDAAVSVNVLDHLADPVAAIGEAHRVLAPGGIFSAATASRFDSPELAHVWRPKPSPFDAEDAAALVARLFDRVEAEWWDAPLITLPDPAAVRDYLVARHVPAERAAALAARVRTPATLTKRGAFVYAYR